MHEAQQKLNMSNQWEILLKTNNVTQEQIDAALAFYQEPTVEILSERLHAIETLRTQTNPWVKVKLPDSFELEIDNFMLYLTDKPVDRLKEELQNQYEKIMVITQEAYQDELAEFAHDKTNRIIAPTSAELTQLLLHPKPHRVLIDILSGCLSFKYFSPYQINSGIKSEENFFGRQEIVRDIITSETSNYLIVGARQLGKSSILDALERRYRNIKTVNCYAFTLEDGNILKAICSEQVLDMPRESCLEDIVTAISKSSKKSVFLIDEADTFIKDEKANGYPISNAFRKLAQEGKATFVLTGFWTLYQYVTLDYQSPLKNFGELIRLEGLETEACRDLMIKPMQRIGVKYADEQIITDLIQRCGNRPNLIAIVCNDLLKTPESNTITQADIDRTINEGTIEEYLKDWGSLSGDADKNRLDRVIVYLTIQRESFRLGDVVTLLTDQGVTVDTNLINESLDRLVVGYILRKLKGDYSYRVPLFKEKLLEDDIEILLAGDLAGL